MEQRSKAPKKASPKPSVATQEPSPFPGVVLHGERRANVEAFPGIPARSPFASPLASKTSKPELPFPGVPLRRQFGDLESSAKRRLSREMDSQEELTEEKHQTERQEENNADRQLSDAPVTSHRVEEREVETHAASMTANVMASSEKRKEDRRSSNEDDDQDDDPNDAVVRFSDEEESETKSEERSADGGRDVPTDLPPPPAPAVEETVFGEVFAEEVSEQPAVAPPVAPPAPAPIFVTSPSQASLVSEGSSGAPSASVTPGPSAVVGAAAALSSSNPPSPAPPQAESPPADRTSPPRPSPPPPAVAAAALNASTSGSPLRFSGADYDAPTLFGTKLTDDMFNELMLEKEDEDAEVDDGEEDEDEYEYEEEDEGQGDSVLAKKGEQERPSERVANLNNRASEEEIPEQQEDGRRIVPEARARWFYFVKTGWKKYTKERSAVIEKHYAAGSLEELCFAKYKIEIAQRNHIELQTGTVHELVRATWFWKNDWGKLVPFFEAFAIKLEQLYREERWGEKLWNEGQYVVLESERSFKYHCADGRVRDVVRGFREDGDDAADDAHAEKVAAAAAAVAAKSPPPKKDRPSEPVDPANACCVCLAAAKDCLLKPCNHVAVCCKDAKQLIKLRQGCPICRVPIDRIERVYIV